MPKAFDKCVKAGGRVRTKDLKGDKYIHICFISGHSFSGDVRTKKSEKNKKK